MHDSRKQFHYSLDSLLKKRNFDLSVLVTEEQHAKQAFSEKTRELDELMHIVINLEGEIRKIQSDETQIIPERLNGMTLFLEQQRDLVVQKIKQVKQAELLHRQIIEQMRKLKQSIKSLEKNKGHRQQQHGIMLQHAVFIEMDNLWLARIRS